VVNVFFFLASAISYMKFFVPNQKNRIGYYLLALLFFILAMASKPTAIVFLPIAAFSIWMYQLQNNRSLKEHFSGLFTLIPFIIAGLFFLVMNHIAAQRDFMTHDMHYSFIQHFLIITSSFGFYAHKFFA